MQLAVDIALGAQCAPPRVLIAEDCELSLGLLRRVLQRRHFILYETASGATALDLVERLRPDLMLLDLRLPELDGLEVLREVRRQYARDRLPIIVVTADDETRTAQLCLQAGANDYLAKPFAWRVIAESIDMRLAERSAMPSRSDDEDIGWREMRAD